jgi:lipopolysaccharide export system ATP-binding protein
MSNDSFNEGSTLNDLHEQPQTAEIKSDYIDHLHEAKKTLRAEGLVKKYSGRSVVNGVDITVTQGEIVGLLGPNGAGKTTTFYMITGMIKPNAGKIFLDDNPITKMAMYRRARMGIGYLSQEASIFRKLTVEQNIMAILQTLDLTRQERKHRLEQLLEDMTITRIAKSKGYSLSGGERRRTEIARALVTNPRFLLLDEPFAGIDPIAVEDIQSIVKGLRERGIGILITDHNVHETLAITNRAYLLFDGRVLKSGSAEYLAEDPEARKLYLGDKFKLRD